MCLALSLDYSTLVRWSHCHSGIQALSATNDDNDNQNDDVNDDDDDDGHFFFRINSVSMSGNLPHFRSFIS